jgi:transcriptional regulator GlxA family with amidase domain
MAQKTVGVLLFPEFELLDVFGPLEAFGQAKDWFRIVMIAEQAGPVTSAQGPSVVADCGLDDCPPLDLLLVPGGMGTRREVNNARLVEWIARRARQVETTTSVCTGAALLAKAGVLDGRRATSNKRAFAWVAEQGPKVDWVRQARWVDDGDVVTSSGVSAGIDMTLHLIGRIAGPAARDEIATRMEYEWTDDAAHDPFAKVWGLV